MFEHFGALEQSQPSLINSSIRSSSVLSSVLISKSTVESRLPSTGEDCSRAEERLLGSGVEASAGAVDV
jgi:hypothetical protein